MPLKIGDAVWLRSEKGDTEPFTAGTISKVQQGGARLTVQWSNGKEVVADTAKVDVFPANPPGSMAPDHCALIHLNEPTVLENTRARFVAGGIYTYTGKILIAVNPFADLPIYTQEAMTKYVDRDIGAKGAEPHVYAMGEAAFRFVRRHRAPAAIIMSGESGSGKTETTKHVMRFLAWRSESLSPQNQGKLTTLADAILKTDPLLEAFGNAKTVRNNNSSRFGKMMRLHFEQSGAVRSPRPRTHAPNI
jgi:myosin heavy subunit